MIFPEIAILWNVREGFEPSPPAMLPALINKNRTYYGSCSQLHHRTPRTDYLAQYAKPNAGTASENLPEILYVPGCEARL